MDRLEKGQALSLDLSYGGVWVRVSDCLFEAQVGGTE